ncbi:small multi-drug export protein [Candidatus Micrarchaeota archaeon]|nr:small multi-drug export protein [Candidatus Micrarchaeota archaeon]
MLQEWIYALILGGAPISEVRGAAIYAFSINQPELILIGAFGNFLAGLALLFFWDLFKIEKIGRKIIGKKIDDKIHDLGKKTEKYGWIGLAIFIGIPLPATGVYTGILLGKILNYSNKHLLAASAIGIIISTTIMFLILNGTLAFLSFLK